MDINYYDSFSSIKSVLNNAGVKQENFYDNLVLRLGKITASDMCGIYFLDLLNLTQKALYLNGEISDKQYHNYFREEITNSILNDKDEHAKYSTREFFKNDFIGFGKKNILISKLMIKGSFFGFIAFMRDKDFSDDEINLISTLTCVYSYAIKDNELNDVFKMQLRALQDAIVEKENAKKTIEKQHKKLLELDKVKNGFLANISHELRTPLNAIIGFSQALDCKIFGELNEKQAEYVKDIHASGLHLLNMINEILDLSKLESKAMKLNPTEISPNILTNEVITILSPLSDKKSIKVKLETDYNGLIRADHQKFQQILYNLLSNAIKFTPNNGEIIVKIYVNGKRFFLEVQDNGIGIEKKYHNKIFSKFVHLNNIYTKSESSTGLGLAITKELVRLHKGKITLTSEIEKGTTFKVEWDGVIQ